MGPQTVDIEEGGIVVTVDAEKDLVAAQVLETIRNVSRCQVCAEGLAIINAIEVVHKVREQMSGLQADVNTEVETDSESPVARIVVTLTSEGFAQPGGAP